MKFKKSIFTTLVICIIFTFSTAVSAQGTLYTGSVYDHGTYRYHLSASANTLEAPNRVMVNGFSQSLYGIDEIRTNVYIFTNSYKMIKSDYGVAYNDNFTDAHATYYGWPSGASYCYAQGAFTFIDDVYGTFVGDDRSSYLYK